MIGKRVVIEVISIHGCIEHWFFFDNYVGVVGVTIGFTFLVYIRIYLTVRRCNRFLQVQDKFQSSDVGYFATLVKSALGIF